ncbi:MULTISPECIES: acyl-ACP--UDP-N-acetylglucosamine O-acyltransferase [unclassified Candidatus Frackibacter]|uniref:acyl-ACP--UDP-N-acetylglucosamine O-acyltransferase n=1 Tax=unclassified Candidatus Frackibacter TaxID=2648818 RepID=UPI0008846DED|nr:MULTISPECIES: acyl-ACP--UDP-N-acetylglucosamine O-acyltransferase [unclassified Candidatus Frackibacter]SDC09558.1 acyl-[acyl-carrier-protein]--UDP-N-acetylglucosamine O-acyltransferase [Candidatus Frackibacter sp. WG11]SEM37722.1 acyl-[acyl-carrier-protein]--UDP-N-acetylglucosamine O-acyltransferase [Candidatus Frackibacter sp. WG12]SFL43179.1 acyl-[acyl-carrier-protein]--UDP-N-acetylglucosamine O-acyltransferase [Candidatus Frackibacter sp. WG13]
MKKKNQKNNVVHMANIHDTAVISSGAKIEKDVEIGPYAVIGENVEIGEGTTIGPHVVIDGWTKIGKNNKFFTGASVGLEPQDLKFDGEESYLTIGDNNTIREYATIHRGTENGGGETRVGNNNLIMAYCHIAHDCQLGDNIVMSNAANLAGHVLVEDSAVITGLTGVHQFVRIGKMAMVGANSKVVKDVPPYILVDGRPASVNGINVVGLRRNGVTPELRKEIKRAYKYLYRSNNNVSQAIEKMEQELDSSPEIEHFLRFLRNAQRGICR